MNTILVSIIVPVYNAKPYLDRCIQSLMVQSLEDIEIILIDDGSTDGSDKICDEYLIRDARITVKHLSNGGPAKARNEGLKIAKGEYIGFVDADDWIHKDMYKHLYDVAIKSSSEMVICNFTVVSKSNETQFHYKNEKNEYCGNDVKEILLNSFYIGTSAKRGLHNVWNKLIKKDIINNNKLFFDEYLIRAEDAFFIFDCLKCIQKVNYLSESLYYYFENPDSIMHSYRPDEYQRLVTVHQKLLSYNNELKFDIDMDSFNSWFLRPVTSYCLQLVRLGKKEEAEKILCDPYYLNAAKYSRKLPIHIRFLTFLSRKHHVKMALFFYSVWDKKND